MNDTISSIWMELGLPRQKKILVCQVYREWQYLDQPDDSSLSIPNQLLRWIEFLDQWERALDENKEILVLGDINLNFLTWTKNVPTGSQAYRLRPLADQLFNKILPHGMTQCVTVPTRFWLGQEPSGLDHFYTNHPEKLSDVQVIFQGGSDHRLIFATRYSKSIVS